MKEKQFEKVSDTELLTEQKKLKKLNKIYSILLVILFITAVYMGIYKENYTFVFVFLALFSIYFVNIKSLQDFKAELERRRL